MIIRTHWKCIDHPGFMQESRKLAFNICVVKTLNFCRKSVKIMELRLNCTKWYATFGTGNSKENACATNARMYYRLTNKIGYASKTASKSSKIFHNHSNTELCWKTIQLTIVFISFTTNDKTSDRREVGKGRLQIILCFLSKLWVPFYWHFSADLDSALSWNFDRLVVYGSFHQVGERFVMVSIVTSVNVPSIILDYKCTFTVVLQIRMKSISPPSIGCYNWDRHKSCPNLVEWPIS